MPIAYFPPQVGHNLLPSRPVASELIRAER